MPSSWPLVTLAGRRPCCLCRGSCTPAGTDLIFTPIQHKKRPRHCFYRRPVRRDREARESGRQHEADAGRRATQTAHPRIRHQQRAQGACSSYERPEDKREMEPSISSSVRFFIPNLDLCSPDERESAEKDGERYGGGEHPRGASRLPQEAHHRLRSTSAVRETHRAHRGAHMHAEQNQENTHRNEGLHIFWRNHQT